jgi:plastocyanin
MKRILLVGAFLVVGAGLSACGDDDARDVLTVQVDGGTMSVSGDPSSGAVDVEINGDLEAGTEVDFTRVSDGTSAEDFVAGLSSILEGGPFADFLLSNAGVAAGGTSTPSVTLEPGSYFVWVETDNDGIVYTQLTVDGDGDDADLPDTDGAFTTKDYGFTVDAKAGDTYTIVNDGSQFHHVVMFDFGDLDPEIVKENLPAFFAADEGDPPPEAFAEVDLANLDVGGSGVFGPGGSGTFEVTLEEGTTYAVVCFIQDRAGGPPHAFAHDMYDAFTVT